MNEFVLLLLIGACWCWGVFTLFHEKYVLERVGDLLRKENDDSPAVMIGTWYSKPLFDCPPCMASVHGLIVFLLIGPHLFDLALPLKQLIPYLISLSGLNFIIKSILFPEYE